MAKRLTNNVITGSDKRLGLYFYYSPHFGHNIIRRTTSLTGQQVKTDKAFKGFRESGNRMKQASPIAAALYRLIPSEIKRYSIYRLLTGEALKMIKAGLDTQVIIETLKRTHIEPLLIGPEKEFNRKDNVGPEKGHLEKGLKSFTQYPVQKLQFPGRIRKRRGAQVLQNVVRVPESQNSSTFSNLQDRNTSVQMKISLIAQGRCKHALNTKEEKMPGLLYMGRLPECKKLKMWVKSSGFPGVSQ